MSFSQGWDAGFKAVLIYVGVIFGWLIFIERFFENLTLSVWIMNILGVVLAVGYFLYRRNLHRAEKAAADAEIRALLEGH